MRRHARAEWTLSTIRKLAEEEGALIELGGVLCDLDRQFRIVGVGWSEPDKLAAVCDLAQEGRIVLAIMGSCVFIGLGSGAYDGAGVGDYD
jgi:hypothetical protein